VSRNAYLHNGTRCVYRFHTVGERTVGMKVNSSQSEHQTLQSILADGCGLVPLEHLIAPGRTDGSEHALHAVDISLWTADSPCLTICTGIAAAEIQRT
jgi:hypothetical protein